MAGIMGFIYVHTHLHCPVSGTLTRGTHSCRETSLFAAAHRNCVHEPWGQSEGLFKSNDRVFLCDCSATVQIRPSQN